ncbi:MAG: IS66 family insertion sequence element accessory protein TnpB [Lewinellaceae bacterium]|nr:IS66 family insertion sequence element accessory protein TnpB [Saprospiraceae bacterium]MCB9336494.1 IS66 family insertion sequence element accessory protein TnpB [Lewinellaceae bacterium]
MYVFLNRRRGRLKLLLWQGDGSSLNYKRLEQGTFEYPRTLEDGSSTLLNWHELVLVLLGVELKSVTTRAVNSACLFTIRWTPKSGWPSARSMPVPSWTNWKPGCRRI